MSPQPTSRAAAAGTHSAQGAFQIGNATDELTLAILTGADGTVAPSSRDIRQQSWEQGGIRTVSGHVMVLQQGAVYERTPVGRISVEHKTAATTSSTLATGFLRATIAANMG